MYLECAFCADCFGPGVAVPSAAGSSVQRHCNRHAGLQVRTHFPALAHQSPHTQVPKEPFPGVDTDAAPTLRQSAKYKDRSQTAAPTIPAARMIHAQMLSERHRAGAKSVQHEKEGVGQHSGVLEAAHGLHAPGVDQPSKDGTRPACVHHPSSEKAAAQLLARGVLSFGWEQSDIVELHGAKHPMGLAKAPQENTDRVNASEEDELLGFLNADFGFSC
jgi:hypothetical protein